MFLKSTLNLILFSTWFAVLSMQLPLAASENQTSVEQRKEIILGDPDAPVFMIEYASLGCSHCADFHRDTFPKLKKNYIDTGKVKFVFRNFPLGTPSVAAAMIAHCAGPNRFFGMIEVFFRSQMQWGRANDPLNALKKSARFGGVTSANVDACLQDQDLLNYVQKIAEMAQTKYNIKSTPSFIINEKVISGALPYSDFKKLIDNILKSKK